MRAVIVLTRLKGIAAAPAYWQFRDGGINRKTTSTMITHTAEYRNYDESKIEAIPGELRDQPHWIAWKYQPRTSGKPEKQPFNPLTDRRDDVTSGAERVAFPDAVAYAETTGKDGVGFVLSDDSGYTVVDFDDCLDDAGNIASPFVQHWYSRLASYTEVSPSGRGIKVWVRATKPGRRTKSTPRHCELYDRARFLTVTGYRHGDATAIEHRQSELDALFRDLFPDTEQSLQPHSEHVGCVFPDTTILAAIRRSNQAAKFARLYDDGDTSGYGDDTSAADQGLCGILAFYTQDREQIDRIFRESALYRDKWDRTDYAERTITYALKHTTERWQPSGDMRAVFAEQSDESTADVPTNSQPRSYQTMLDRKKDRKPKTPMIIDKKLPIGLTIFAGKPKIGKGWLLLQETHDLIKNGRKVLYYGLEEEDTMIDERVMDVLGWDDDVLDGFVLETELGMLGQSTYHNLERRKTDQSDSRAAARAPIPETCAESALPSTPTSTAFRS